MKFNAFVMFVILWPIFVYYPLAHWVWHPEGWLGSRVRINLQNVQLISISISKGVKDFAGGIVIHTSSGVAAFIVALILQRRKGFQLRGRKREHIKKIPLKGPLGFLGYIFRRVLAHRLAHSLLMSLIATQDPEESDKLAYHNLPLSYVGGTIIWVGW